MPPSLLSGASESISSSSGLAPPLEQTSSSGPTFAYCSGKTIGPLEEVRRFEMSVYPLPAGEDERITTWLEEHGVTEFEFRPRISLNDIDRDASLKNQARTAAIDEDHLIVMAEAMSQGKRLPPIVVYKRPRAKALKVIDGNHRVGAAELNDLTHLSGYVITQELTETQERLLICTANTGQGLPNTLAELVQFGIWLVQHRGTTQKDAAHLVSIPAKMLGDRLALLAAEQRFAELIGIARLNRITGVSRRRLHAIKSDVVAKEAAALASETRMKTEDVGRLVVAVNKGRSEAEQLAIIHSAREERSQQDAATAGHKVQVAAPFRRLSQLTTGILKFDLESVRDPIVDTKVRQQIKLRVAEAQEKLLAIAQAL